MTVTTLNINENQKIFTIVGIIKESPLDVFLELDSSSIMICDFDANSIRIPTKEATLNLIKALEKAIELEWVK